MFTLGGVAISWKSLKQTIIDISTKEYEFIELYKCEEKVEWLHYFLEDILRWLKPMPLICIHCDS